MKFILMKKFLFLVLIMTVEINNTSAKMKEIDIRKNYISKKETNSQFDNHFRFESIEKADNDKMDKNILILNSEILNAKPPSDKEEEETQVFPQKANAGSEFIWKFLWWTLMYFPAKNALTSDSSYWLSKRGVAHDHWEAIFDTPQKLDIIEIRWRLPPKRFRVFIKLDEKSDYIPVTQVFEKTSFINSEGKVSSVDAISEYNAVIFNKPVFARRVRINLNEPIRQHSFSIFTVKFFQKKITMIIKNELLDPSQHYCMFVNTNLPRANSKVEAYPCVKSVALANNNEMWIYNNDSSIRHYNSKFCLGFDNENELVLRQCDDYNAAYTVQFRSDNTLFFTGYEDKCIVIDEMKKVSSNFMSPDTEIIVTTQADDQSFKKENIVISGETYWYATPGQAKATLQILFGKIKTGPLRGKYEKRKIDLIKIDWIKAPLKFMVYTWKPGYSWELLEVYDDYKGEVSEIEVLGEEISAVMLVLEKAHKYQELGNLTTYAIKEVSIISKSIPLKNAKCGDFSTKLKMFDFDPQSYHKLENKKAYDEVRKKLSISFEKNIANYSNLKRGNPYVKKARLKALELEDKLNKIKYTISDESLKKLTDFKSTMLSTIKNPMFEKYVRAHNQRFFEGITNQKTGEDKLGTKDLPAIDCLSIKKLQKNSLSGWYYIKPECAQKPLRVFCDFTIFGDATDFYIFNDDSKESNPDLSYLKIKDFNSIRYQCAKLGLHPLQINNSETVERIYQVLTSFGYNLADPIAIPLGYDYTCSNGKCGGLINSINDRQTPVISSFFAKQEKSGVTVKPGAFAGFGYSSTHSMFKFDPFSVKISGLICSTNHFKTDSTDLQVKKISCEMSPMNDGNIFIEGGTILVECPPSCQDAKREVYGTNTYHLKSSICKAALHTGAINSFGGRVKVRIGKSVEKYAGSIANGISSDDYTKNDGMNSFSLQKYNSNCPINQFKELEIAEGTRSKEDNPSSFAETATLIQYKQVREKFSADLNSNELEGVDLDDINKAGVKANSQNIDFNKKEYDSEDEEYNKTHSTIENDLQVNNDEGNKALENIPENNQASEMFNFSEVDTISTEIPGLGKLKGATSKLKKAASSGASSLVKNVKEAGSSLADKAKSTASNLADKAQSTASNLADKAKEASSGLIDKAKGAADNALSQLSNKLGGEDTSSNSEPNNGTDDSNNNEQGTNRRESLVSNDQNEQSKQADPNDPNTPIPPPDNSQLPEAPKPPSPPEDEPKKKTNQRKEPSTDEGNKMITKIRKAIDYEYLDEIKTKTLKVKKIIDEYQQSLSWSKEGSKLSNSFMKKNLFLVEKYKMEVLYISKSLGEAARGRVLKTSKLREEWRDELNKEESKDAFKLDYSIQSEILFKEVFMVINTKSNIKSNWSIVKENIKDRARAIGITSKIYSQNQLIASLLSVYGKDYFDFNLKVDILVKSTGVAGIVFRMLNEYNFYAFVIDKVNGSKKILKVVNGRMVILKTVSDGGILINNWHHVNIKVTADNITVFIYDVEQPNKTASEKILEVNDTTFVSGGVGMFVNNIEGFYFDKLEVSSNTCWTPWIPMKDIDITTSMSSVYVEDFAGTLSEKFDKIEADNFVDGPSDWRMNQFYSPDKPIGLNQKSLVYDNSATRKPSMLILKNKIFKNGVLTVSFTPSVNEGIISVIFKYLLRKVGTGSSSEEFYIFEMIANKTSPQLVLRRFSNGVVREITSVSKKIKDLPTLGFKNGVLHTVQIEDVNTTIKIKMSINNSPMVEVINVIENSIPHGRVGVGTFQAKTVFSRIDIFPPMVTISEEDKNKIMASDSNELYFPPLPLPQKKGVNKQNNPPKGMVSQNGKNNNANNNGGEGLKLSTGKAKDNGAFIGWETCLNNATTELRERWCERTFPIEVIRSKCKNNYCDVCCKQYASPLHKNSRYSCTKACTKATISQADQDDFKSICIHSANPIYNIYDFCENKLNGEPDKKKVCKLDMCNLCCSTMDQIMNREYSIDSIKTCFNVCNKEFNTE